MKISELPAGTAPAALTYDYFPAPYQAVIWRNWNLVSADRLAQILHGSTEQIRQAAAAMGLSEHPEELSLWAERGFQTIIRRNWELLDYEQLLELLQWTPEKLYFTLKEDDFFFYKLGLRKPVCPKVYYRPLTAEEDAMTAQIKALAEKELSEAPLTDRPFSFLKNYGRHPQLPVHQGDFNLKMTYSYSALYGDPLMDDDLDSYPEGLLKDYAACGVNAIWLQGTLYTLVPWLGEDLELSKQWEKRQRNLRKLVQRAAAYGIDVILYLNEPRCMPASFFNDHPDWRGIGDENRDSFALCTSVPAVREALGRGVKELFRSVPGLGGVFTITMSENLTHCKSRRGEVCPRCAGRSADELAAEVNNLIAEAMHSVAPAAKMIAYSWAWENPEEVIRRLRPDVTVMSVSERHIETECLGYKGRVEDYSVSKPGPGSAAKMVWSSALSHGAPAVAKVQLNCSWELAAVPYIPVPDLVEQHLANLKKNGVSDLMLCWTLGGYPGGNLELLAMDRRELAEYKFGAAAAPKILEAWSCFSRAFHSYFPFNGVAVIYFAPQNFGPMTILHEKPTGRSATMIGFPYDDIDTWCGVTDNPATPPLPNPIPRTVLREAFQRLSEEWKKGVDILSGLTLEGAAGDAWRDLYDVSLACYCHFRSAYLQICWVEKRMDRDILKEEIQLARTLLQLVRRDSRIGYEASNHYFYTENDLIEKILNCQSLLNNLHP